jgi:hypothetical protein
MLLKEDFVSVLVVEPTVTAFAADDGEYLQASPPLLFPAATTTTTPLSTALLTAVFNDVSKPPPMLMLMTQRNAAPLHLPTTKLIPLMTPELDPLPLELKICTGHITQLLATP